MATRANTARKATANRSRTATKTTTTAKTTKKSTKTTDLTKQYIENGNNQYLHDILSQVQNKLHENKIQQIVPQYQNGTEWIKFFKRDSKKLHQRENAITSMNQLQFIDGMDNNDDDEDNEYDTTSDSDSDINQQQLAQHKSMLALARQSDDNDYKDNDDNIQQYNSEEFDSDGVDELSDLKEDDQYLKLIYQDKQNGTNVSKS